METVHIALSANQNYFAGLEVTAASIAVYASLETPLHFHILDGGIEDREFESFVKIIQDLHVKSKFSRYNIREKEFKSLPAWGGNYMTYARLMLPEIMSEYSHVIYSDVDVLWLAQIEGLWAMRDAYIIAHVCRDEHSITEAKETDWYKKKNYPVPGKDYFCAGIMMLNLDLLRSEKIVEKVLEFIEHNPDINFADQTALNQVLLKRVKIIPKYWHMLSIQVTNQTFRLPLVIHYANEVPWQRKTRWAMISDTVLLWSWFNDIFILKKKGYTLKIYYSLIERVYKRLLFIILTNSFMQEIFYLFLRLLGKDKLFRWMKKFLNRIDRSLLLEVRRNWKDRIKSGKS